ncbi:PfkB family carbohydrate kinase [Ligilactobacillus apodemi]|nr:PfkB family carbohydrate kinase [Ligilactobacillus apodemi]MCR1901766.1 PfkB family carbohydrate kinase [Ligilactobacillus apodemi]
MSHIDFSEKMLIAQDLSAIGNLSLAVAIPLFEIQQIPVAILPTSLLSTQSEGFGTPVKLDCRFWVKNVFRHWQDQNIRITAALVGYLDDPQIGEDIYTYLKQNELALVVIDPAFADEGKFYPNLDDRHLRLQQKLLQVADYATPNLTEACLLTQTSLSPTPTEAELITLLKRCATYLKKEGQVVITGVELAGKKGCVWLADGKLATCLFPRLTGHFYGSGDVFSALFASFLRQGVVFEQAIKQATHLTYEALKETAQLASERTHGIVLGPLLAKLTRGSAK